MTSGRNRGMLAAALLMAAGGASVDEMTDRFMADRPAQPKHRAPQYERHQGEREIARRKRQIANGQIRVSA
jgi:hypothetical protein